MVPPTTRPTSYDSDLIVLLDLELTLIKACAISAEELLSVAAASDPPFSIINIPGEQRGKSYAYQIYKRPHLDEFLRTVRAKFETHIFAAARQPYADEIIDLLDPDKTIFTHCWYRDSCSCHQIINTSCCCCREIQTVRTKDLEVAIVSKLEYVTNLERIVLVHDNKINLKNNPRNGIIVSEFNDTATGNRNSNDDRTLATQCLGFVVGAGG